MTNFLQFIEEDIQAKKTLFSTLPTSTKSNIKKYNEKVQVNLEKYREYEQLIKKYINAKDKSFEIQNKKNDSIIKDAVTKLEHIKFVLNPTNTYFEKMGFETLFYQIHNYRDLKFSSLNDIINELLKKLEIAGVGITANDFDYTCYVYEFMSSFLEIRKSEANSFEKMNDIFEKIYWINPEIVEHIELNFRKIIKRNIKKFDEYITKKQREILVNNKLNYDECLEKLEIAYKELEKASKENISEVIDLAKAGTIDINNYFEDSKVRNSTLTGLMIDPINMENSNAVDNFYENLEKLALNVKEYGNYKRFVPLFEDFKKEYLKKEVTPDKNNNISKMIKDIEVKINSNESKLEKINKKISSLRISQKKEGTLKELKFESVKQANLIYELYNEFEELYFKDKVALLISSTSTITDLLHLYYSYDYFKKKGLKKVFNITNYDEIMELSDEFDLFAMNPTNVIINGISLYEENNIASIIVNKYRLANINITESDLADLTSINDRINMALRIRLIDNSETTVEKIWFMAAVAKFNGKK